jgi:hypothetical protein
MALNGSFSERAEGESFRCIVLHTSTREHPMKGSMAELGTISVYKTSRRSSSTWCDAQLQMKAAVPLKKSLRTKGLSAADTKTHCEDPHQGHSGNPWCNSRQIRAQQAFFKYSMAYKGLPFSISKSSTVTCRDRFACTPW